ncbi:snare-like protein [Parathielavia hyrcaniae]|uniref:Snare-like protein n=1 Tax=Parathielavia hyrcaniae TaxID=113614 RepID=A0AAN6PZQ6_9PEZI|nr:snare-like protein [Parathielavia hyrcaniae]
MKTYYVGVLDSTKKPALQLCAAYELSEFCRLIKQKFRYLMTKVSKTLTEEMGAGQQESFMEEGGFVIHCYNHSEGVAGVIIAVDYPDQAAYRVLPTLLDQFMSEVPLTSIRTAAKDGDVLFPAVCDYLYK